MTRARICIVTPGYISSTPRVVREADALTGAGYDVRVVFTQGQLEHVKAFDRETLAGRAWRSAAYGWSNQEASERWRFHTSRIRHRIARAVPSFTWPINGIVERAEGRIYPELAALAAAEAADLFIGHYPVGLAAASHAAAVHHAKLGYDVEDLYAEVFPDTAEYRAERRRIFAIERRYVHRCAYLSAVSEPAARRFAERYDREMPAIVHNCHPWADRAKLDGLTLQRRGPALSLYWFSQTVGLNRGLQDVIRAAGLIKSPLQIHLQGSADDSVKHELTTLAADCGVPSLLHFHGSVPPEQLPSRASEHDIGLALETDDTINRQLAVTNKLFLYFVAGLAVAASDLPGQHSVMARCPGAGFLYRPGDFKALAAGLDTWQRHRSQLDRAKLASLEAGEHTWNWEIEGQHVVNAVEQVLGSAQPGHAAVPARRVG